MTHKRSMWWPILLTSIGWVVACAIFMAFFESYRWFETGAIGKAIRWLGYTYVCIRYFSAGAFGGLVTSIAIRKEIPDFQWKQLLFVTIGWGIGFIIGMLTWQYIGLIIKGYAFRWTIRWLSIGVIGGLATMIVIRKLISGFQWKQSLFVTIGWVLGWVIGGGIYYAIADAIRGIKGMVSGISIGWAIAGVIGGSIMFLVINQTRKKALTS